MGNFRVFRGERKTKRGEGGEGFRIEDFEKDDWGDLPRSIFLLPPLLLLQFLSHPVCWLCLGPKRIMINGTGSRSIRNFEEEKFGRTKKKEIVWRSSSHLGPCLQASELDQCGVGHGKGDGRSRNTSKWHYWNIGSVRRCGISVFLPPHKAQYQTQDIGNEVLKTLRSNKMFENSFWVKGFRSKKASWFWGIPLSGGTGFATCWLVNICIILQFSNRRRLIKERGDGEKGKEGTLWKRRGRREQLMLGRIWIVAFTNSPIVRTFLCCWANSIEWNPNFILSPNDVTEFDIPQFIPCFPPSLFNVKA